MSQSSIDTEISVTEFAYYSHRLQARVFEALVAAFAEEYHADRISRAELARRINRKPEQITRWFSSPSDMKLSTISRLLVGMEAELDPAIAFFRDRAQPNYAHPLIDQLAATDSSDMHALPVEQEIKDVPASPTRASEPTAVVQEPIYL